MKYKNVIPALLMSVAVALALPAAAQEAAGEDHSAHHPDASKTQPAPAKPPRSGKAMNGGMKGMGGCPMHEEMMGSKSPEEKQAMMERRIKSMSPEMRKKRMEMMDKHMRMMQKEMEMMREQQK